MSNAALLRRYQETHPWIDFTADLKALSHKTWMLIGEAQSKCEHIAGVPLKPMEQDSLNNIYLSKGVHGTTSIEGNTLTEEEVLKIIEGDLDLPPSREYQQQEIENILAAYNHIIGDVVHGRTLELTSERIKMFNRMVLEETELRDGVTPGQFRTDQVGVMRYRAVPAEDAEYLVDRMCQWLQDLQVVDDEMRFAIAVFKSILAHLYLAWIHPFDDGNGRVARLIEFQLLIEAGVPVPAAHLMSDFYNLTRDRYYIELDRTSTRQPYSVDGFLHYAIQGFVDQLRDQLQFVRGFQMRATWENFVHGALGKKKETPARRRQKHLVFDMPHDQPVTRDEIPDLSPRLAREYADKTRKTVTRDLTALSKLGLVVRREKGWIPNIAVLEGFLPLTHPTD
ncbi:MAG: Fic family protein [Actinobacteria bacterium]|nr:Fic family protein [Actinomycetota bacterium]